MSVSQFAFSKKYGNTRQFRSYRELYLDKVEEGAGVHIQKLRSYTGVCFPHFVLLVGILSIVPTIINRFPLVFWDSGEYISAWTTNHHVVHPLFYSFFVWVTSHAINIYFTVICQAALSIYVLWVFFQAAVSPSREPTFVIGSVAAVLLLTQLLWLINWLMPDVFFGLGALCIMACVLFNERMWIRDKIHLFFIAVFSTIVATANVMVLVPFGLACVVMRRLILRKSCDSRFATVAFLFGLLVIVVSIAANIVSVGRAVMNPGWAALGFSKLVDAGIAQKFLHANCSTKAFEICKYLGELDKIHGDGEFLWQVADRIDAWRDPSGNLGRAVLVIAWAELPEVLSLALHDVVILFSLPTLGSGDLIAYPKGTGTYYSVAEFYPAFLPDFATARQQTGNLLNWIPRRYYGFLTYLSYGLVILLLMVSLIRSDRVGVSLALATTLLIVLGLAVHGGFGKAEPRYHVKVSWVAWVSAIIGLCRWGGKPPLEEDSFESCQ